MKGKWFVLSVKKGDELRIKEWFDRVSEKVKREKGILEVAVPTQLVYKVKNNKNVREEQPKLPKAIYLKIDVNGAVSSEDILLDKVKDFFTGCPYKLFFVRAEERGGKEKNIYPIPQKEINRLIKDKKNASAASNETVSFDINEQVKIIDGPFKGVTGTITSFNKKNSKVKLKITFFSRDIEIDISSSMIAKI
jgi:transcriptional antiterminator NusG